MKFKKSKDAGKPGLFLRAISIAVNQVLQALASMPDIHEAVKSKSLVAINETGLLCGFGRMDHARR